MPPQGPPGPQAQQAPLPAAAATSAPAPVHPLASPGPAGPPGPGAAAASTDGGDAGTGAGLAGLAGLAGNNTSNCSSHDQPPALRKRRAADTAGPAADDAAPDTGELPCPVQDGAKGTAPTMPTTPAGGSGNGCALGGHGGPGTPPVPVPESPATPAPSSTTPACPHDPHDNDEPKEPKLLTFHDVPQHLQFNPYIVNGYRPMSNFWGSLRSLFYLHNETVNIVTHGIPIVYILLVVPGLVPWARLDRLGRFLAWCHLVGAVSPWVGSFVYHLFMNLQAGERVYNRLLRLDMFGIWICQSFGALPMVTATVFCLPWNVRWFVISSYCMLSLCGLYKAMTAWSPWDRRLSFALPWVSRLVLCLVRACLGGGSPNNMLHLILQDGVSLVGGVVGAVYFPEKYFPGMVDYCLNSHNIMHVLTVAAVYSMHCATMLDLEWIASVDCKPAGPPWPPWPVWQPVANRTEL